MGKNRSILGGMESRKPGTRSVTFLVAGTRLCEKSKGVARGVDLLFQQIFDDDDKLSLFPVTEDSGFRFIGVLFF